MFASFHATQLTRVLGLDSRWIPDIFWRFEGKKKSNVQMWSTISRGENTIKYTLEETRHGNVALPFSREYFRTSLMGKKCTKKKKKKLKEKTQSCQLDSSHRRRGGTSLNERGGM